MGEVFTWIKPGSSRTGGKWRFQSFAKQKAGVRKLANFLLLHRAVVSRGAEFGCSVYPIPTRGGQIMPTTLLLAPPDLKT